MANILDFSSFMAKNWIWLVVIGAVIFVAAIISIILLTRKPKQEEAKEEEKVEYKEEPVVEAEATEESASEAEEPAPAKALTKSATKKTSSTKKTVKAEEPKEEVKEKKKVEKYSVVYSKEDKMWVVKKSGTNRSNRKFKLKADAIAYAEKVAEKNDMTFSVKSMKGKFQKVKTNSKSETSQD